MLLQNLNVLHYSFTSVKVEAVASSPQRTYPASSRKSSTSSTRTRERVMMMSRRRTAAVAVAVTEAVKTRSSFGQAWRALPVLALPLCLNFD
jgi:hypothetical protein